MVVCSQHSGGRGRQVSVCESEVRLVYTVRVLGQPGLHSEALPLKIKIKLKNKDLESGSVEYLPRMYKTTCPVSRTTQRYTKIDTDIATDKTILPKNYPSSP